MADNETPSGQPGQVVAPTATAPTATSDDVTAAPSKSDWAGMAKATRAAVQGVETLQRQVADLVAVVAKNATAAPAAHTTPASNGAANTPPPANMGPDTSALAAELAGLKRSLTLTQFFAANQISDAKQQEVLTRALASTSPDKVAAEAADLWAAFKPTVPSQPGQDAAKVPSVPAAPISKTSAQAPAFQVSTSNVRGGSIFSAPRELIDTMSDAELKAAYRQENPRHRNIYADARAAAKKQ